MSTLELEGRGAMPADPIIDDPKQRRSILLAVCIALMAVMFPLGMMNIAALAAVTAIVFWEKVLPYGPAAKRFAGVALVAFGLAVLAAPGLLPGTHEGTPNHSHA